jgi:hypothetical protein
MLPETTGSAPADRGPHRRSASEASFRKSSGPLERRREMTLRREARRRRDLRERVIRALDQCAGKVFANPNAQAWLYGYQINWSRPVV